MRITARWLVLSALPMAVMAFPVVSTAGPIYQFALENRGPNLRNATGTLRLSDEAFAERLVDDVATDLESFSFTVRDVFGKRLTQTKNICDFTDTICLAFFPVSADGERLLGGPFAPDLRIGDGSDDVSFDAEALSPLWEGSFGSEGGICSDPDEPGGECFFSGRWTLRVPEPGTLAILGAGLLGLAALRRPRPAGVGSRTEA